MMKMATRKAAASRMAVPQIMPCRDAGGQTRRRGEALEAALLDAAWAELQSSGYAGLTMEAVADRAGTSRAVLYRRLRSRPELVVAAMRRHRPMLRRLRPPAGPGAAHQRRRHDHDPEARRRPRRGPPRRPAAGGDAAHDLFRHELLRYRTPPSGRVLDEILDEVFLPRQALSPARPVASPADRASSLPGLLGESPGGS